MLRNKNSARRKRSQPANPRKLIKNIIRSQEAGFRRAACLRALRPTLGKAITPFPDKMRCCLTYVERSVSVLVNSAAVSRQEFSGNSLFDPNFTGTGAQPEYFDQLAALYNRYRVYGSAVQVTLLPFNSAGSQTNVPADVVLVPTAQSLASATIETAAAIPRAQFRTSTGNMSYENQTMFASASTHDILGVKDVEGADRLQALVSASPSEQWLWAIVAKTGSDVNTTSLYINIRISYDCEFYDRQTPAQSLASKPSKKSQEQKVESKTLPALVTEPTEQELRELSLLRTLRPSARGPGSSDDGFIKIRSVPSGKVL